jgi:acyl transferase domain-containing protein
LNPTLTVGFSQGKMMAGDGACKAFDERADGYVRSEGVGVVVLKLLSQALADGDHIHAVIRGSACSNDGHSDGFMAPSTIGQQLGLRKAINNAGVDPLSIDYVEAHGPGTRAGDPVEITTLGEVLCQQRAEQLLVGSVKTNIGHTEGSAGVAGLIKTVLCLQHGLITPNLHFHTPSSAIPWETYPSITIPTELTPWPVHAETPRRAVVCSYGISGTNSYVVLEEAPQATPCQADQHHDISSILPLSARSREALTALAQRYVEHLADPAHANQSFYDISSAASLRRTPHDYRLAVISASKEDARNKLQGFLHGNKADPELVTGTKMERAQPKIAWIFPGQGSQWLHMGRDLFAQEPAFRAAIEACDRVMRNYVDWSLLEVLQENEDPARLDEIDVIQPTLFAVEVALAELWRSWGITPDAVVGHSMGETAAAYIAGALSLEDAAWIICSRSKLALRQRGKGLMAAVELSLEQASKLIQDQQLEELVSVAVSNSPNSTVLSGDAEAIQKLLAILERETTFARLVRVDFASHSPQMDPLRDDLLGLMQRVQPQTATIPMFSTVRGAFIDGKDLDARYWVDNLREPVLFLNATQALLAEGFTLFMEMSPHPILAGAIRQTVEQSDKSALALGSLRRDEGRNALLTTLGTVYANGYDVAWSHLYPDGGRHVSLPAYPWQRQRYWNDQMYLQQTSGSGHRRNGHAILGTSVPSALHPDTYFWTAEMNADLYPFLNEHRVDEIAVLPGSAYTDLALAVATEVFGPRCFQVESVVLSRALFFPKGSTTTLQATLTPGEAGTMTFQLFSKPAQDTSNKRANVSWLLHAQATIRPLEQPLTPKNSPYAEPEQVQKEWALEFSSAELYENFRHGGMQHGTLFQSVTGVWRHANETMAHLVIPTEITDDYRGYQLHPALLDAVQHAIAPFFFGQSDEGTFLPVSIGQVKLYRSPKPGETLWSHATVQSEHTVASSGTVEGDITLIDEHGEILLEIFGFRLQLLDRSDSLIFLRQRLNRMLYTIRWEPQSLPTAATGTPRKKWLVFSEHQGLGEDLTTQIQALGGECVVVTPGDAFQYIEEHHYEVNPSVPEDFHSLFTTSGDEAPPAFDGVIYLWGLLTQAAGKDEPSYLTPTSQEYGSVGLLHLIQAIATHQEEHTPRLWIVTRGVHAIESDDTTAALFQAPLWSFRRVVAYEHPGMLCTAIDLAATPTQQDIQNLFQEIWHEHDTDEVALRENQRYAAQLVRRELPEEGTEPLFHADGTYLITGGLSGVGLRTAQWMVEQGARYIALLGRHGATEQTQAKIDTLRETGATISIVQADVSHRELLAEALDVLRRKMPPLRGVFHSAVVLDDGTLLQLDRQRLLGVTPPKIDGSWNLHLLTRNDPLDYFVMFSTVASTLGSPAQGNYAAASAFMDALAFYRRQHGLPALALNWGRWAEVGQAIVNERMDARGFVGMKPIESLTILGNLLQQTPTQISVMNFSFAKWSQFFPELLRSSYFAELSKEEKAVQNQDSTFQFTRDMYVAMAKEQRQPTLSRYLEQQIAQVLGDATLTFEGHQDLSRLGIDSLMAVELKNRINADLSIAISPVIFLQGLLFDQLTMQIEEALGE